MDTLDRVDTLDPTRSKLTSHKDKASERQWSTDDEDPLKHAHLFHCCDKCTDVLLSACLRCLLFLLNEILPPAEDTKDQQSKGKTYDATIQGIKQKRAENAKACGGLEQKKMAMKEERWLKEHVASVERRKHGAPPPDKSLWTNAVDLNAHKHTVSNGVTGMVSDVCSPRDKTVTLSRPSSPRSVVSPQLSPRVQRAISDVGSPRAQMAEGHRGGEPRISQRPSSLSTSPRRVSSNIALVRSEPNLTSLRLPIGTSSCGNASPRSAAAALCSPRSTGSIPMASPRMKQHQRSRTGTASMGRESPCSPR